MIMENICTQDEYKRIEQLVEKFCRIVLTKKDRLDIDVANQYLDNLTTEDKTYLNQEDPKKDPQIRLIVLLQIKSYLQT